MKGLKSSSDSTKEVRLGRNIKFKVIIKREK
jgi:hypothetical protein